MSAAITPVQTIMSILHTNGMALIWVFALVSEKKVEIKKNRTEEEIFFAQRKNLHKKE